MTLLPRFPVLRPTRRAILLAAAGTLFAALPILVSPRLWTFWPMFCGVLVLGLGADAIASPRRSAVTCALGRPATLYIGEPDDLEVRIGIGARWHIPFEMRIDFSELLTPQPSHHGRCPPDGAVVQVPLDPQRRGLAIVSEVWIRYAGPLGLLSTVASFAVGETVPIVPNIKPVRTAALRFFSDREFRAGLKIERYSGDGTQFDSLREFTPGLDHRSLDWKASARHRKLICRENRAERNHQVVFAVDSGALMCERLAGIPKLDHAINGALLLAYICLRTGDRVGLHTFDAQVGLSVSPQGGMATHRSLTQLSADVAYSGVETNFTLGLTTLQRRLRRRSLIIVLTDFADTVSAELMVENLHRLARRHLTLFVALRDPLLAEIAGQEPHSDLQINQSVVASNLLRDREVVLRRLRRSGIVCIDVPPERIGAEMINTYLDIKRRERI